MPIPDFQTIMSPLLSYSSDNNEHSLRETNKYYSTLQFNPRCNFEPLTAKYSVTFYNFN